MAGNVARKRPKPPNPAKLAMLAKKFTEVGAKNARAKDELGAFAFKHMYGSDLTKAIRFWYNEFYIELRSMAKINALGTVSPAWIKMVIHTFVMGLVLESEGLGENYNKLSYSHRAKFVGVDFSRSAFVAETCKLAVEGEWNVSSLSQYLRTHALRTGNRKLTPAMAKRTVRKIVHIAEHAKAIRTASKSTYRKMLGHLDPDEFDVFDRNFKAHYYELVRFIKDVEAERVARQKKSK